MQCLSSPCPHSLSGSHRICDAVKSLRAGATSACLRVIRLYRLKHRTLLNAYAGAMCGDCPRQIQQTQQLPLKPCLRPLTLKALGKPYRPVPSVTTTGMSVMPVTCAIVCSMSKQLVHILRMIDCSSCCSCTAQQILQMQMLGGGHSSLCGISYQLPQRLQQAPLFGSPQQALLMPQPACVNCAVQNLHQSSKRRPFK